MPRGKPFENGNKANPGGRPKVEGAVRELAREYTAEAIKTLAEIMRAKASGAKARVAAANALLDRGYGKPPQELNHTGDGLPVSITMNVIGPKR